MWQSVTMFPADLLTRSFLPILTAYLSRAVWIVCTVPPSIYISPHYVHTSSPSSLCLVFYQNTTIPLEYEQCHYIKLSIASFIISFISRCKIQQETRSFSRQALILPPLAKNPSRANDANGWRRRYDLSTEIMKNKRWPDLRLLLRSLRTSKELETEPITPPLSVLDQAQVSLEGWLPYSTRQRTAALIKTPTSRLTASPTKNSLPIRERTLSITRKPSPRSILL
jgi:hypothetical protein